MKNTLYFFAFLCLITSCGDTSSSEKKPPAITSWGIDGVENLEEDRFPNSERTDLFKEFTDTFKIFSITFPENWKTQEQTEFNEYFLRSIDTTLKGKHKVGISIREVTKDSLTLEQLFRNDFYQIITTGKEDIQFKNGGKAILAGLKSYWFSYSYNDGNNNEAMMYYIQNYKKNDNYYLIENYSADSITHPENLLRLRGIIESFKFLD